jgi:hypothetical protein
VSAQLYLFEGIRENHILDLDEIRNSYFDRIKPAFENIEEEGKEFQKKLEKELKEAISPEQSAKGEVAFDEISEYTFDQAGDQYNRWALMRYRALCMWIALLTQVWEQQNMNFIRDELDTDGVLVNGQTLVNVGINNIKEIYEAFGVDIDKLSSWPKIVELRHLVNVIKHVEGNSANKLRILRPDYFNTDGWGDPLELYRNSLNNEAMNVSEEDLTEYHVAVVQFWQELPERMHLQKEN